MIEFACVDFYYKKDRPLFNNLSFKIKKGLVTGIFGLNGVGKSTLLKLICGLVYAKGGSVKVDEISADLRSIRVLSNLFFLPEDFELPKISIRRYLKANKLFYPNFDLNMFTEILEKFDLEESQCLEDLSFGQRKKVLIGFALSTKCKYILMDEPTNGLDIPSKVLFRKILAGTLDDEQTVLISTHQTKDIETLIDDVLILKNGGLGYHNSTDKISESFYFGSDSGIDENKYLYYEKEPSGYKYVAKNTQNISSEVDLEMFFNAVMTSKYFQNDKDK